MLSVAVCSAFMLQACHDDDFVATADAPKQVLDITSGVYAQMRAAPSANSLFQLAGTVAGTGAAVGDEPCQVKLHKMSYDTVGGAGEATTATGAVMVPYGTNAVCNGPRPVVLYAHGTTANRDYDLSTIIADQGNAANSEGAIMLAFYAAQGYVVVAPNYAGYADSALSYHPYADEVQQSTDMIDALEHVRTHAANIGADLSSKLFITGMSQGGYAAMATHKALQAKGEAVTASTLISGPYALGDFLDAVVAGGAVNGGATTFAPMYLTALQNAHNIYDNPNEVYASSTVEDMDYASFAENSLPAPGANVAEDVGLPVSALFSNNFTAPTNHEFGYDDDHLLSDTFRMQYIAAFSGDETSNAAYKVRNLAHEGDLSDWTPSSPVTLCGAGNDPVVFHAINSDATAAKLGAFVTNLDLTETATAAPTTAPEGVNAAMQAQWQGADISLADIHSTTAVYCAGAGLGLFNSL